MKIYIGFIVTVFIYFFAYDYLYFYHYALQPYKKINTMPIKSILVGLPAIDRDADIFLYVYNSLVNSSAHLLNKYKIELSFVCITREKDNIIRQLWGNTGVRVLTMENYNIKKRHNFDKMAITFNILAEEAKNHDALFILESDIILNKDTMLLLYERLYTCHVSLAYFNVPWCGYPVILVPGVIPHLKNADTMPGKDSVILGHGTGAIMIRSEVFKDCKFSNKKYFGIEGQDVGFFMSAFKNGYKTIMIKNKVHHLYNRKKVKETLRIKIKH